MFTNVSGLILAGGKSSRLGREKALIEFNGKRLIELQVEIFKEIFQETIITCKETAPFLNQPCTVVCDILDEVTPLSGIYTGLKASSSKWTFVLACDMPFLKRELIEFLISLVDNYDVVVPLLSTGYEPLHAIYSKNCIRAIEKMFEIRNFRIYDLYKKVRTRTVNEDQLRTIDKELQSFMNINTPEDLQKIGCGVRSSFFT